MSIAGLHRGAIPAPPARGLWVDSCHRRFVAAVLASALLHWLLLTAYDPRTPIQAGLPAAAWRPLDASLRLEPPSPDEPVIKGKEDSATLMPPARTRTRGGISGATAESGVTTAQTPVAAATAPAGDAETSPDAPSRVDIEAARQFARRMARAEAQQHRGPALAPSVSAREARLGRAIAASARPDCRTAYSGAGLFAIPALIIDAVTDKGCSW